MSVNLINRRSLRRLERAADGLLLLLLDLFHWTGCHSISHRHCLFRLQIDTFSVIGGLIIQRLETERTYRL
jgi:hypothetical protein